MLEKPLNKNLSSLILPSMMFSSSAEDSGEPLKVEFNLTCFLHFLLLCWFCSVWLTYQIEEKKRLVKVYLPNSGKLAWTFPWRIALYFPSVAQPRTSRFPFNNMMENTKMTSCASSPLSFLIFLWSGG